MQDKLAVIKHIEKREGRFTVTITDGIKRSNEQNRTYYKWLGELAQQSIEQGITEQEWRAYLKLHIGIPILRRDNEAFRIQYNKTVLNLSYEQKMLIMQEPINFPVTSLMTVKQKSEFMDEVFKRMSQEGYTLTDPSWQGWENIK